jgi:hypothetical protein
MALQTWVSGWLIENGAASSYIPTASREGDRDGNDPVAAR